MSGKQIPIETLVVLQNNLDALPPRSSQRRILIDETAELYGISSATLRRALRKHHQPQSTCRADYNHPRNLSQAEMKRYCELVAALKLRTTNKKGRHLSTKECLRLLENHGVETGEGLVTLPPGLLSRTTVERYLQRWGFDTQSMTIEPTAVRFQAVHSNDCWQFDFSPSDLKKLKHEKKPAAGEREPTLMLASVVDDRSGLCYQEYHYVHGEDAMTALRFFFNAMALKTNARNPFQGIPSILYLDNGPVTRSKVFNRVMAHLGVEVKPHMPKGSDGRRTTARAKGKVERVFRTVKDSLETLYHFHEPRSVTEANEWLQHYLTRYNAMPHRSEDHSRQKDWLTNLPSEGLREMCSWERFCTFARDPEQRKVGSDACVNAGGIRYQMSSEMAGQEVTLLWGLFDNELYVEFNSEKQGPFYPAQGPIPLGTYRKARKSSTEKRADYIGDLAQKITIPVSALSGETTPVKALLNAANVTQIPQPISIPFDETNPFELAQFKNTIEAKLAIAKYLDRPLSRLTVGQMAQINNILSETLDKKHVLAQVRTYFSLSLKERPGDQSCMGK